MAAKSENEERKSEETIGEVAGGEVKTETGRRWRISEKARGAARHVA
jgi:hypothetical protein